MLQVTGCQRVLLIPPEQAFNGMYPYPVHHPYDTYSMVDLEDPDLGQWPHNANVTGLCCILKPGDVLYLPAYWYVLHQHHLDFGSGEGHCHTADHWDLSELCQVEALHDCLGRCVPSQ